MHLRIASGRVPMSLLNLASTSIASSGALHAGMVAASLASLQLAGSFVEVGKRDIWSPARMAQERPDVAYHLIAIDFLPPTAINASMRHVSTLLAAGTAFTHFLCP